MNLNSIHSVLIIAHAAAATICFLAGCLLIFVPTYTSNQGLFSLYWWSLTGMVVLLVGAILVHWTKFSTTERIVFPGLLVLGIYMIFRARSANQIFRNQQNHWIHNFIEHIGFTLISLFEGFIIVSGLNSGLPSWLVAVVAILGVLVGRWAVGFAQRRIV